MSTQSIKENLEAVRQYMKLHPEQREAVMEEARMVLSLAKENIQDNSMPPDLVDIAENALQDALSDIMDDNSLADSIWEQFMTILSAYKNAVASSMNNAIRDEIYQQALSDEYEDIKERAITDALNDPSAENEFSNLRAEVEEKLYKQLRPIVIEKLKTELLADQVFIAEVKNDLKKTILGL